MKKIILKGYLINEDTPNNILRTDDIVVRYSNNYGLTTKWILNWVLINKQILIQISTIFVFNGRET